MLEVNNMINIHSDVVMSLSLSASRMVASVLYNFLGSLMFLSSGVPSVSILVSAEVLVVGEADLDLGPSGTSS